MSVRQAMSSVEADGRRFETRVTEALSVWNDQQSRNFQNHVSEPLQSAKARLVREMADFAQQIDAANNEL